jgi:hypothetical protein
MLAMSALRVALSAPGPDNQEPADILLLCISAAIPEMIS